MKARRMKKCRVCKQPFSPANSLQIACKAKCALEYAREQARKKEAKEEREWKAETARRKEEAKTLKTLCVELQRIVNEYIRWRDVLAGYKCISCGERDITDAGHFYHAGSKYQISRLRFNLLNLNGQCEHCNRYAGGGNALAYLEGFILRHGQEKLDELKAAKLAADRGEEKPLTKDEVRGMKVEFRAMIRELKRKAA